MVTARSNRPATYEDLLAVPSNMVAEILDGELVVSPRPASRHGWAASCIGMDLGPPFRGKTGGSRGPGGWWIVDEPELHLHEDVVVPDLGGWRRERMPVLVDVPAFTLAPDWVCEVLSPSTARHDRVHKSRIYAREGVGFYWQVDPLAQVVEAFELRNGQWLRIAAHEGDDKARIPPFEAVELELAAWWATE